jgi:hypothetical protein
MNLDKALRIAKWMGCAVTVVSGTGERQVSHPLMKKPIRFNNRKKSAPRVLTRALRKLEKVLTVNR